MYRTFVTDVRLYLPRRGYTNYKKYFPIKRNRRLIGNTAMCKCRPITFFFARVRHLVKAMGGAEPMLSQRRRLFVVIDSRHENITGTSCVSE